MSNDSQQPVLRSSWYRSSASGVVRLLAVAVGVGAALGYCLALSGSAWAQQEAEFPSLKPGDKASGWSGLPGVDGKEHSLADLNSQKVVVVCFTSNTCPYSVDYEERMITLQKSFRDAGRPVTLVAINSNATGADDLTAMTARAAERKFNFAYLKDETQSVARTWGALYTPEFFVLNEDRTIVFRGAMDDQTEASRVTRNYVAQAVEAALNGRTPDVTEIPARGCAVRYKRARR